MTAPAEKEETPVSSYTTSWGPKLFWAVFVLILVFFWWLLIYAGGAVIHHG